VLQFKRTGWTKSNAFHVCITSYKLVVQDHASFRRKKWRYLILDEVRAAFCAGHGVSFIRLVVLASFAANDEILLLNHELLLCASVN